MEYDIQNFTDSFMQSLVSFYNSPFVLVIKIFIAIYIFVLLADFVMMLILRDVSQHLRVGLRGADLPLISKSKMQKRWDAIKGRLKGDNISQYKVAIIEADKIAEEILDGIGYKGANMSEKLEQVTGVQLDDHLESLKGAHQIRNKIVHEADYVIDKRMAEAVIGVYESFLKYLEYLG